MYPFICCYSCGRSIGDLCDAFKALRLLEYQKAFNDPDIADIDPVLLAITEDITVDLSPIFDQLGIPETAICCRTRLCTQVEFKELY
jgi:DNA-directed RNA polymerase subunit N (RpoN/RPB10)